MNITLSIINHNHEKNIKKLLKTLNKKLTVTKRDKIQIIITNNLQKKKWNFSTKKFRIIVINNDIKLGFGQNHNQAFNKIQQKCDFFCVVNPDIYCFEELNISKLFSDLKKNIIYSLLILNKNKIISNFFRKEISIYNLLSRKYLKKKKEDINNYDWLAGVFLIFSYKLYKSLNGFDERYFMYVEDCDICLRAKKKGYKLKILKNFRIIHLAQRESHKSIKFFFWHVKSLFIYFLKKNSIIK